MTLRIRFRLTKFSKARFARRPFHNPAVATTAAGYHKNQYISVIKFFCLTTRLSIFDPLAVL